MLRLHLRRPITFLVPTLEPGGAERKTVVLANALAARGWDVDICTIWDTPGLYRQEMRSDIGFHAFGLRSRFDFLPIARYLRESRPRLMVGVMHAAAVYGIVANHLSRTATPLIFLEGGLNLTAHRGARWYYLRLKLELALAYRHAARIVVGAVPIADELVERAYVRRDRITIIDTPSAVPVFADVADPGFPDERWPQGPVIATIARLDINKDVATLLRAFALVRRDRAAALAIFGKGPEREALQALAAELGVASDVHFLGVVEKPWRYLRHAAAYVNSSITEGLSNALIEAMAVGCPVIATDAPGGNAHILQGGRIGALVPVGDAAAMAHAIEAMLDTPPARERIIARAHDFGECAVDAYIDLFTRYAK